MTRHLTSGDERSPHRHGAYAPGRSADEPEITILDNAPAPPSWSITERLRRVRHRVGPLVKAALSPVEVERVVAVFAAELERHQATINRLNVFPVPDGDTGTNMLATVVAAREALAELGAGSDGGEAPMAERCSVLARAALMGARGNSGVILCQLLRGVATTFAPLDEVRAPALAAGLELGATSAREAVLRPVEGTILTVASAAAAAATSAAAAGSELAEVVRIARDEAVAALWSTPALLPVLADAGVVDAGGAGLLCMYESLISVICESAPPDELALPDAVRAVLAGLGGAVEHAREDEDGLRYEVMYLLEAPDETIPAFREVWAGIGDSIVVVGGEGLWNCHIHTDEIGSALEAALDVGRPRNIRVTDLADQVEEERWVRAATGALSDEPPVTSRTAVVAVSSGEGVGRIFRSLGVSAIVAGGQSMNPSTAELLRALEDAPGEEVVVLPNNTNIYPVAREAAALASKPIVVVETPGIQEGFAALLEYDPAAACAENGRAMAAAAARVRAGEVTRAVRSSSSAAGPVAEGDWIALDRSAILAVADSAAAAACALLEAMLRESDEIVTLIEGAGATEAASRAIGEWLSEHHPRLALERHRGGQPLYPYLVSIE